MFVFVPYVSRGCAIASSWFDAFPLQCSLPVSLCLLRVSHCVVALIGIVCLCSGFVFVVLRGCVLGLCVCVFVCGVCCCVYVLFVLRCCVCVCCCYVVVVVVLCVIVCVGLCSVVFGGVVIFSCVCVV